MTLQEALPVIVAALAIVTLGGALSVVVVLKRLAFIGQGISHAAFGGVGIALVSGLVGGSTASNLGQGAVIVSFSIAAALWIAHLTKTTAGGSDTAIGVVLSVSMALGFVLVQIAAGRYERKHKGHDHASEAMSGHEDSHHAIEEILFGNILDVSWNGAMLAVGAMVVLLAMAWAMRSKLIFWAYDESVCGSFGVNADRVRQGFFVLLAVAIVVAMQLAGVVLAAAIFVLPGAAALNLGGRLRTVFILSTLLALIGAGLGIAIGLAIAWPIGPSIVAAQGLLYAVTLGVHRALR
jgi:zinc transport system permease protein